MKRRRVAVALLALGLAASGARGEAGPDRNGFALELDDWWSASRDRDLDYAFSGSSDVASGGTVRTLGAERAHVPRVFLGWRPRGEDGPVVGVRLWEHEGEASDATGSLPGDVGPLLASPVFYTPQPPFRPKLADSAGAAGRVRATLVEVEFSWERPSLTFGAGLRGFRFEETVTVRYDTAHVFLGQPVQLGEVITREVDASGLGPSLSLAFARTFGRLRPRAGISAAYLVGRLEQLATDTALIDGAVDDAVAVDRPGTRRGFTQFGLQVGVDVRLAGEVWLTIGYRVERWPTIDRDVRFLDAILPSAASGSTRGVAFEGPLLGVRLRP